MKIGERKAFKIMRIALLTGGIAKWNLLVNRISKERSFLNFCNQELKVNRAGWTKWNTLVVVERTERRFEIIITRCMYHEPAISLGISDINASLNVRS